MMNILILAAGQEQSTQEDQYPPCLVEYHSVPLIQRVMEACHPLEAKHVVAFFREDQVKRYYLDSIVKLLHPDATICAVQHPTQGALCTALLAVDKIDCQDELLIINGNEWLDMDFKPIVTYFRQRRLDAGVVVFPSIHPRYSYVKVDASDLVCEAAEKRPISTHATVGFYWFSRGHDFVRAAKNVIRKDACLHGVFYLCPVFNELVLEGQQIGVYPIDKNAYYPLKTVRQVEQFESTSERVRG